MSDDGETAIVLIALLGNPFSPAYARARKRGPASALEFASMNVALYSRSASAWSLGERVVRESERSATSLAIGASTMRWDGDRIVVDIDERTTPLGSPIKGTVILHPEAHPGIEHRIDESGEHLWWPISPLARIEVDFPVPGVKFSGHGYHDANAGETSIESSFDTWSWSRARSDDGARITYDAISRSGRERSHAFRVSRNGEIHELDALSRASLTGTVWGLDRIVRVDEDALAERPPRLVRSLENGPFYSRALVETTLGGQRVVAMHETLAAHRLRRQWVRALTLFRMRDFR